MSDIKYDANIVIYDELILFHDDIYISDLVNGYESKTLIFLIKFNVNIIKLINCKTFYI